MKGLCTRLLLSVTCFSLCLTFASPVRAGEDAAQVFPQVQADTELPYEPEDASMSMNRADRLLLLSNVVSLWKLRVSIGQVQPDDMIRAETFGLVKNGQLSPSFVARAALQIMLRDADAPRLSGPEWQAPPRPADVPQQYDIYISFEQLERTAQEWLGWPFDKSALPQVDYLLQKENCLYADVQMLLKSWPSPMFHPREYDIFAVPFKIYLEQDTWIMKGEVWGFQQAQNDILDVITCETFRLVVQKTGKHWRILSLDFSV